MGTFGVICASVRLWVGSFHWIGNKEKVITTKGVVFYFFPGKDSEPLTISFSRFADEKKKIQSKNFRLFRFGPVNLGEPPPK